MQNPRISECRQPPGWGTPCRAGRLAQLEWAGSFVSPVSSLFKCAPLQLGCYWTSFIIIKWHFPVLFAFCWTFRPDGGWGNLWGCSQIGKRLRNRQCHWQLACEIGAVPWDWALDLWGLRSLWGVSVRTELWDTQWVLENWLWLKSTTGTYGKMLIMVDFVGWYLVIPWWFQSGFLRRLYKQPRKEEKQKARENGGDIHSWMQTFRARTDEEAFLNE